MKILKILFFVFAGILFLFLAGTFIFLATFDANKYIPQIVQGIQSATGRTASIGRVAVGFSLTRGIGLDISDFVLADNPSFSSKPFLQAAHLHLGIDLFAFLREQRIVISKIAIKSPQVIIVRDKKGALNAASLAPQPQKGSSLKKDDGSVGSAVALPVILVKKIEVVDGNITFNDLMMSPPASIHCNSLMLVVNNFSLLDPFDFHLSAALFSPVSNLSLTGRAGLDMKSMMVRIKDADFKFGLDEIVSSVLNEALPVLKPAGFRSAKGAAGFIIYDALVGASGLTQLKAETMINVSNVVFEGGNLLATSVKNVPLLPDLLDKVMDVLPENSKINFRNGITVFSKIAVNAHIVDDKVTLGVTEFVTDDFAAVLKGAAPLAGPLDFKLDAFLTAHLSEILIAKVSDISGLQEPDKRIYVPFSIRGSWLKPTVLPDMEYLRKHILVSVGKQEIQRYIKDPSAAAAVDALFNGLFDKKK